MVDPRTTADRLVKDLRDVFGRHVNSVVLFGSVPRGEAVPGLSDMNILVLLEALGPREIADAAPVVQAWTLAGNSPPHIYSRSEWVGMRDTFAIEITDMQDARDVLYGADPVADHTITPADLRLHAEQEARSALLNMRLRMMLSAADPGELGALLVSGVPSFAAYMRAVLRLNGAAPGLDSPTAIERASLVIGADPEPLLRCWEARRGRTPVEARMDEPLVSGYLDLAQRLTAYLDTLQATSAATGPQQVLSV